MKQISIALAGAASLFVLAACTTPVAADTAAKDAAMAMAEANSMALEAVLEAQPAEVQARYSARNPAETIAFFGVEPGMTVVEALPGGGWYSKILMPYIGTEGTLVGAHYPDDMWVNFGWDADRIAGVVKGNAEWKTTAMAWDVENSPEVQSVYLTQMPDDLNGTADAVLFIRALHNLNRFEDKGGYLSKTLADTYDVLKPGGIVGVVQHRAPVSAPAEWADGSKGYLKEADLIAKFEAAGFVLEGSSEINANPKDVPGADDIVWRLPPSTATTKEGTPERAAMEAIGESDRMTLKFRKPK